MPRPHRRPAHGTILGTVQYMAPEQVEGKEADAPSDTWALGAVIYEMATGTRPFTGDTPASVIGAILKDDPPSIPAQIRIDAFDGGWRVTYTRVLPEIALHTFKYGPTATTRCADAAGYRLVLVPFAVVPKAETAQTFCAIPYDSAMNVGAIFERVLQ